MHTDRWWGEGVVGRENQGSPVLAAMVGGVLRTGNNIVPPVREAGQ